MAVETVFLAVLVVALVIGHFFLEVTKPKKQFLENEEVSAETQKLLMPSETLSTNHVSALNDRLDRLEKILLSAKPLPATKIENGLHKKIQSLVDFKNEIRIEVAALKEQVKEIKDFVGMKEKQKQHEPEIDNERLHELVYNVRK